MDRSARKVLQNNRSVLCSVLDASMVAAAAVDVGLLNQEESEQVLRHGSPMANFLELLLERRPAATPSSPESSPIRGRNAADGSGAGRGDAFRLFLLVLESLEDYRTWAKFLEDEYELAEAHNSMDDSELEDETSDIWIPDDIKEKAEFHRLTDLSESVDQKVRSFQSRRVSNTSNSSLAFHYQQPLTDDSKLLREFKKTMKTSEKDVRVLLQLYRAHCDILSLRDSSMKTLLHIAAVRMEFRVVKMMLEEFRFRPNEQDISGNTPLHLACLARKTQIVVYLLHAPECDPNIQNGEGDTPFHLCARIGDDTITKFLFNSLRIDKSITNFEEDTAVAIMDQMESELVKDLHHDIPKPEACFSPPVNEEEGLLKAGTEILVRHKKLHAMLVSKNPKWKMPSEEESWCMPEEGDAKSYNITAPFPGPQSVLRDKAKECKCLPAKKKKKTREERLHEVLSLLNLWRSLCFLLVSIFVGVAICIILAVLLIRSTD